MSGGGGTYPQLTSDAVKQLLDRSRIECAMTGCRSALLCRQSSPCKAQKICYNSDMELHDYKEGYSSCNDSKQLNEKNLFPYSPITLFTLKHKAVAFTLAEVLITLGIIGVVAAITIPSLITKYRISVLENAYKKMDSTIDQAILLAKTDIGIDDFAKSASNDGIYNYRYYETVFFKYLPPMEELTNKYLLNYKSTNFSNTAESSVVNGFFANPPYILRDGSRIYFTVNSWKMYIAFDTNGLKGPNRLGYDIFLKVTTTDKELTSYDNLPETCSFTSSDTENGFGCYYFARSNTSPDGSGKGYWQSLRW